MTLRLRMEILAQPLPISPFFTLLEARRLPSLTGPLHLLGTKILNFGIAERDCPWSIHGTGRRGKAL